VQHSRKNAPAGVDFLAMSSVDKFVRGSLAFSSKTQQGSSSFLKKRTKKFLLCWLMRQARSVRTAASKSFLVLFLKKELLPLRLLYFEVEHSTALYEVAAAALKEPQCA
jgi:hypothetical protein